MTRLAVKLVVFLLLGVVTTVAVAWGCALWVNVPTGMTRSTQRVDGEERPHWIIMELRRAGALRVRSMWYSPDINIAGPSVTYQTTQPKPDELVPRGLDWVRPPEVIGTLGMSHQRVADARALPGTVVWLGDRYRYVLRRSCANDGGWWSGVFA